MFRISNALGLSLLVLSAACNLPAGTTALPVTESPSTSVAPAAPTGAPPPAAQPPANPPEHRIGIRLVNGAAEFFERRTGARFVPRGNNYVRLGRQTKEDGSMTFGHSLFDPGSYDPSRVAFDLGKMHADGYNVVRVFLSPDTMGSSIGDFSTGYMDNIIDFLEQARASEMYVMFTQDWIPGGKYGAILNKDCCTTFTSMNANYLPPAGLEANRSFFQDFAGELIRRGAATEYIWSYQLRNEMFYDSDQPPLSLGSGLVTAANGVSYDMSNAADKQRMIEENNVFWIDSIRAAILGVDPTALVSVGFFVPHGPNAARIGDPRTVVPVSVIARSQVDFIDLHAYPGFELNLLQTVQNFQMQTVQDRPIVMGEFGGEVSRFPSIQAAAETFIDWQVESCQYGFDGWLFWTWDTNEQPDFFNALMQDGAINGALAPILRPDPCVR